MKSDGSMHEQAEQDDDSEVNITDSTSQDETENSSSFGNTLSGDEEGETVSDSEVMSKLRDNGFDQECRMRKKSLTAHWKTFIQPLMWRIRLAELQIRRLLSQATKYDLQAEALGRTKQLKLKNSTVEGSCARAIPFSGSNRKQTLIKRRKRKRVEDSTDTAAYIAQHPLFSYSGSKKFNADVVASLNNSANRGISTNNRIKGDFVFGCNDEPGSLKFRNDDDSLEQIYWKIEGLQSHLGKLKTRFKKVHDENAKDIYSADAMDANDVRTSPAQNEVSTNEREKLVQVSGVASQLMPECCDMIKNGTAISTHEEATELIDIIECNDQLQIGISCEKEGNGRLVYNSPAKELNSSEKVEDQATEKPETLEGEAQANIVLPVPVPLISISDELPTENPEPLKDEEQVSVVPSVPVISISDDEPEDREEEEAIMNPSSPVPVTSTSIADDQPAPKRRSITRLTSSFYNTRSRGRGRGRGRRRGHRWSHRA